MRRSLSSLKTLATSVAFVAIFFVAASAAAESARTGKFRLVAGKTYQVTGLVRRESEKLVLESRSPAGAPVRIWIEKDKTGNLATLAGQIHSLWIEARVKVIASADPSLLRGEAQKITVVPPNPLAEMMKSVPVKF